MFENAITVLIRQTQKIVFVADSDDGHMINVQFIKGDKLKRTALIIKPDLQQWIDIYKRKGYV